MVSFSFFPTIFLHEYFAQRALLLLEVIILTLIFSIFTDLENPYFYFKLLNIADSLITYVSMYSISLFSITNWLLHSDFD